LPASSNASWSLWRHYSRFIPHQFIPIVTEELLRAIREVHAGRRYIPAIVAKTLAESLPRPELTRREIEVLRLIRFRTAEQRDRSSVEYRVTDQPDYRIALDLISLTQMGQH